MQSQKKKSKLKKKKKGEIKTTFQNQSIIINQAHGGTETEKRFREN